MKKSIAIVGALAASLAMGAQSQPVQVVPANQQQSQQQDKQTPAAEMKVPKQRISLNNYGGLDFAPLGYGLSPKEYGMRLQSMGKQKWNKRK